MARDVHDLFSFAPSPKALPVSANFRVRILTLEDFFLGRRVMRLENHEGFKSSPGRDKSDPAISPPDTMSVSGPNVPEKVSDDDSTIHAPSLTAEGKGEDDYPDGGLRAWLVVVGAMCNTFSTFGFVNSWGVFQSYYQQTILRDTPSSDIAWIGSLQYALVFLPAVLAGRLFDLGYHKHLSIGSGMLLVLGTFLVPQCTQYWHFILCQGITIGLACGGIMNPTTAVIAHWFKKRRGLAMGMMAVGSSLGGTLIPIMARNLIPIIGFAWTMRTIGFVLMFFLTIANLTLRRRLPPVVVSGGLFNFRAFKSISYSLYCASTFVTFLGVYTFLTYVDVSAVQIGISEDFSFYLVSIANAASGLGRYAAGLTADRVGAINTMIPFTAIAAIMTYAWPFAESKGPLIALTVLYGFSSGSYVSLLSNPPMDLGSIDDVGRRVGMVMTILAAGAVCGPPISGAIHEATEGGGFQNVGYYAGSTILLGVMLMIVVKWTKLGTLRGKM